VKQPRTSGIRHIQLNQPLSTLSLAEGEEAVYAIFWWNELALGARLFTAGELPVCADALAAVAADLVSPAVERYLGPAKGKLALGQLDAFLRGLEAQAERTGLTVSVVVCTRNRPEKLAVCLASLVKCEPAPLEIIVVDNNPADRRTRAAVEAVAGVRYVPEEAPGLSRARNTGVRAARGDIIAFTDDDVQVSANWLVGLKAAFADPKIGCVTGLVLPSTLDNEGAFAFEFDYGGFGNSFVPVNYDHRFLDVPWTMAAQVWDIGAGANMAIRKAMIASIGDFDVRLGAGACGCSEDSEFWHRTLHAGWKCYYEPASIVFHEHRADRAALARQLRAYIRGHVVALFVQYGNDGHIGNLVRAFVGFPVHFANTFGHALFTGDRIRRRMMWWEVLGYLEAPFSWLKHWNTSRRASRLSVSGHSLQRPQNQP
jgi:glycosyltransferase involved in cell wall biosynthesis